MQNIEKSVNQFMDEIKGKNPNQPEFHQAVHEVAESRRDGRAGQAAHPKWRSPRQW